VDSARPVRRHGIPQKQLRCELAAVGLDPVKFQLLNGSDAYFAAFRAARPRPAPERIKPCRG